MDKNCDVHILRLNTRCASLLTLTEVKLVNNNIRFFSSAILGMNNTIFLCCVFKLTSTRKPNVTVKYILTLTLFFVYCSYKVLKFIKYNVLDMILKLFYFYFTFFSIL